MPFGISPAPELFQQKLDQNLEGLRGVHRIFDDLLITGKGGSLLAASQDHGRNLRSLLESAKKGTSSSIERSSCSNAPKLHSSVTC